MRPSLSFLWYKLAGIRLTVVLCLSLAGVLACGYACLNRHANIFTPLDDIGLLAWIETYGRHNLTHTAWFFALLGLLGLLGLNTFVCTTDRVVGLIRSRARLGPGKLVFKLAPHLMHYASILILAGYLCSYLFAQVLVSRTLVPGASMVLPPSTGRITLESFDPVYAEGARLASFQNRVLWPRARLILSDDGVRETATLTLNRPIGFKGYRLFLEDFAPKQRGGMASRVRVDMCIRKDPGVGLYLAGMLLFALGLLVYLAGWIGFKRPRRETR